MPWGTRYQPSPTRSSPINCTKEGKILFTCLLAFFTVLLFLICYYTRRLSLRNRRVRNTTITTTTTTTTISSSSSSSSSTTSSPSRDGRLNHKILASLPLFVYSSMAPESKTECAVCLTELKDGEKGRLLPSCNHMFHADCVDMWFHSHSTCPLCRSNVEPRVPDSAV